MTTNDDTRTCRGARLLDDGWWTSLDTRLPVVETPWDGAAAMHRVLEYAASPDRVSTLDDFWLGCHLLGREHDATHDGGGYLLVADVVAGQPSLVACRLREAIEMTYFYPAELPAAVAAQARSLARQVLYAATLRPQPWPRGRGPRRPWSRRLVAALAGMPVPPGLRPKD